MRVTNSAGLQAESEAQTISTKTLNAPTFSEEETSGGKTITINYPEGTGLTYEYQKDGGSWTSATQNQQVEFTEDGTLIARVTDGVNTVTSSSYTVTVSRPASETLPELAGVVTSGNGLYADANESGRYVYKGASASVNNYIQFNNELWRIISIETDGTIKILRNSVLTDQAWDTSNSNNWARPATLNTYLNGTYYNGLSAEARGQTANHAWDIGAVTYGNTNLAGQITTEKSSQWTGNIGLITNSDWIRANSNMSSCGTDSAQRSNYTTCRNTNWMYNSDYWWTISPFAHDSASVFRVSSGGVVSNTYAHNSSIAPRPAAYLSSEIEITGGSGTSTDPYIIE